MPVMNGWPVNELGEIVVSSGSGSGSTAGSVPEDYLPIGNDGKLRLSGLPSPSVNVSPLFFNRFLTERPVSKTPAGIASYARGELAFTVMAVTGTNTLTYVSGSPLTDAGASSWMGVINSGDVYQTVAVLSQTGGVFTLAEPISMSGTITLYSYHDAFNGIHLSPAGGKALADMLVDAPTHYLLGNQPATYDADSTRGTWYGTPWVSPFFSPQYWKQIGGLPNNAIVYNDNQNISVSGVNYADSSTNATVQLQGVGQGVEITLQNSPAGIVQVALGHGKNSINLTDTFTYSVICDGVTIFSTTQASPVRQYRTMVKKCSALTIRVTSNSASVIGLNIGKVSLINSPTSQRKAICKGDVVMIVGDSWTDEFSTRPEFSQRLRYRADIIGATVATSVGVAGTKADYALVVVNGERRIDTWIKKVNPTVCVVHYYLNEYNSAVPASMWVANMQEIVSTLLAKGITPIVMLPGSTASDTGTQGLLNNYGRQLGEPSCQIGITEALQSEVAAKSSFVNTTSKYVGKAITVGLGTYFARGNLNTSPWDCITSGVTPTSITPA